MLFKGFVETAVLSQPFLKVIPGCIGPPNLRRPSEPDNRIPIRVLSRGAGSNRMFVDDAVVWKRPIDEALQPLLYDPQTSGGLLIAVPDSSCGALTRELGSICPGAAVIGRVVERRDHRLVIV